MAWLLLLSLLCRPPEQPESWRTPDSANMTATWRWDRGGVTASVTYSDITYVGSGSAVLVLRDSVIVSAVELAGICQDLLLDGEYLYVAAGKAGLAVLSIADPEHPVIVGELDFTGYSEAIAKSGELGVVSAGPDGIALIDLAEPSSPRLLSTAVIADTVTQAVLRDRVVYAACDRQGLLILDAREPQSLNLLSRVICPGAALGVALRDSIAYVMCGESLLTMVNVARPDGPVVLGRLDIAGARQMSIADTVAAVASGAYGAWLVNVADPAEPRVLCYVSVPGYALDVSIEPGRMSVAGGSDGLYRYDITNLFYPMLFDRLRPPGYVSDMAVRGSVAWVSMTSGLFAVDVNNPGPELGGLPLPQPLSVALGMDFAVVALGDSGIAVVSISDPARPMLVAWLRLAGAAGCVAVRDSWAFIGTGGKEISVVSVARPSQPVSVATLANIPGPTSISIRDSVMAIAAGDSGLYLCDIADPTRPSIIQRVELPGKVNAVSYDTVTACCGDSGLFLLDTRDVASPELLSRSALVAEGWDVVVQDTLCYVASDWVGVVAFNIKDPGEPWPAGYYAGASIAKSVAVAGGEPVMGDVYSGLTRLKLELPAVGYTPIEPLYPVVVAPSVQIPPVVWAAVYSDPDPANVSLLDISGRVVAGPSVAAAGSWQVVTFSAYPLGAGTFFLRVQFGTRERVTKLQLIR